VSERNEGVYVNMSMIEPEFQQNLSYTNPINSWEIENTRHKSEKGLFILCVISSFLVVLFLLWDAFIAGGLIGGLIGMIFFGGIFLLFLFIFLYKMYARTRAYSVKVSEKNFPEIYQKSVEFAGKLGMEKVPAVYVEQQNGMINAFATAVIGKRYIGINAEIVDIAYMEDKDFEPVYFVLAHELAHHYFKHTSISTILLTFFGMIVPVLGSAYSRSREYSCDRLAQLLLEKECAREAMILSAGRHLYKHVDLDDYIDNAKTERGFGIWLMNLVASHPIPLKRIAALTDPERKSGKLF